MNVLVVGSGGREHALGWKISQSKARVYYAPGNGGTSENVPIASNDLQRLVEFAREKRCFTVVGPEEPLSLGIADLFTKNDLEIFGPTKEAAMIETSKAWAKEFMKRHGIRTANFQIFDDIEKAKDYVKGKEEVVVKADGLAAGKGVIVCNNSEEALKAIDKMGEFGDAGRRIVIEEKLKGEEVSFIAMSDGRYVIPLASSQDHKRVYDDDKGPNTGGMGAYSPMPLIDDDMQERIMRDVMQRAVDGMRHEGRTFKGFLYAGLMINDGIHVLEFNARMGDPECQAIVVRMRSDLLKYMKYCCMERLNELEPMEWSKQASVCVVLTSKGYPANYEKGKVIHGLEKVKNATLFHAATRRDNGIVTNGGRVLGVTALGNNIKDAIRNAYDAVSMIHFDGMHYRKDIGMKALRYER